MTRLQDLYNQCGQSPWLDNLSRSVIKGGELARLVDIGIRGVTSNPTIFQKAMTGSDAYDDQFRELIRKDSVEAAFWDMAIQDVTNACGVLRPVHDESGGTDGFVSLEVSPTLAWDTDGTTEAARSLHERISLPNLMVKIPATEEGVPAIKAMAAEGRNINVTLIFSLERYGEVMEAYLSGLEAFAGAGGDLSKVHGIGSFFVSRVDTEVDRRLQNVTGGEKLAGKAAVAQAKLAYEMFQQRFSGP
ncbi:MAG TPA: transaldolase family protein, partial [Acidimicrobiales bacterium]|nr:transaldolase family protein [Acidimicrobiales bacterium]